MSSETIIRGNKTEAFLSSGSITGRISESGESWEVSLSGTFAQIRSVVSELYVGSTWTPSNVNFASKNNLRISGWSVLQSPGCATLRIEYAFNPNISFFSSGSGELPESVSESISASIVAVSLQDCPGIWTEEQLNESYSQMRALYVEYAKAKLGLYRATGDYKILCEQWESNFEKDATKIYDSTVSAPWQDSSYKKIEKLLASGQDLYNTTAYQVSITETLNTKPTLSGLNSYNTPELRTLSLPSDATAKFWYQNSDGLTINSNGQFQRTRTWLGVATKSPLYATQE